jgi:dihydrofolate synthase/folylpolyglutamate synthase
VSKHKEWFSKIGMSFFEMTVALAFHHFSEEKVDIAVIETGLGGRLDSTNIITPELSVITNIGLDHTNLLGDTLEKIAVEKAGIIKDNVAVVLGRKQHHLMPIFKSIAQQKKSTLILSKECPFPCDLLGQYQNENKATAYTAIQYLRKNNWKISDEHLSKGLLNIQKNTALKGRWTILEKHPLIVCDTAHNLDGLSVIVEQIQHTPHNNLHIIFGVVNDKSIDDILQLLPKNAEYYFCQANIPRALDAKLLKEKALFFQLKGHHYSSVSLALKAAKNNADNKDLIFIGGSTFTVAEIL